MPTPLNDTLLEAAAEAKPRGNRRVEVVAAATLMLMAGFVGFSMGTSSDGLEKHHDTVFAKITSFHKAGANQTELAIVSYAPSCYGFTGGTCLSEGCDASRNAQCLDGKCSCVGGCSSANGECGRAPYKKIAEGFTLTNQKWTSYWLFMPGATVLNQLKVSSGAAFTWNGQQQFDLYELPGRIDGKKQYFLGSNKWPSYVASIASTGSIATGSVSPWGLFAYNLDHTIAPWDIQSTIVSICSLQHQGNPDGVMIGRKVLGGRTEWAYVHHGSWYVYGWGLSQDPGPGGYWTVNTPLEGLDDC